MTTMTIMTSCTKTEYVEVENTDRIEMLNQQIDQLMQELSALNAEILAYQTADIIQQGQVDLLNQQIDALVEEIDDLNKEVKSGSITGVFYGLVLNTGWNSCGAGAVKRLDRKIYRKIYRCVNIYYILHENSKQVEIRIVREGMETTSEFVTTWQEGHEFIVANYDEN